ncbi:MAG: hypothetical protein ACE5D6_06440 [Candidatus Zixiibacteriota bacterium]
MKKIIGLSLLFMLIGTKQVMAVNFAVITNPPTLLNFVILLVAIGCLVGIMKILSLLKGGYLFKSWQIFMLSFVVLTLCQGAILLEDFEIIFIPQYIIPAMLIVTFGLFLYGILMTKRTLE